MKRRHERKAELEIVFSAAGSLTAVADLLGITKQTVSGWEQVPAEHCKRIEKAFGVPAELQRPDIFGPPRGRPGNAVAA